MDPLISPAMDSTVRLLFFYKNDFTMKHLPKVGILLFPHVWVNLYLYKSNFWNEMSHKDRNIYFLSFGKTKKKKIKIIPVNQVEYLMV